ncbi:hypothetical protein CEQ06_06165 [Corynebacterium jeikeium]|nr:hypothetical protein CEQ06_05825 [Corynebacterium jeikeium]ASE56587.1 hypothetical protein CEQ06_06165 [Corynebacterium jeikeium]
MTEPTITYDEMKAALEKDACGRETEPELFALLDKLNPTPPLFGRWAEHPHHGRGVIISNALNEDRWVRFAHKIKAPGDNIGINYVDYAHLKTDPALLDTYADFNDAPEGTIAEIMVEPKGVYVKKDSVWRGAGEEYPTPVQSLAKARVIRWGNGQ